MTGIEALVSLSQSFIIQQKKEWIEIFSGIETKNKYTILDGDKSELGFLAEEGKGFTHFIKRWFLRSHRPFVFSVFNKDGQRVLKLHRKFFWFFSDLFIEFENKKYGSIHREFAIFTKKYTIKDANGEDVFKIRSPFWRIWSFPVKNISDNEVGIITKKWQGLLKEAFTDSDAFLIDCKNINDLDKKVLLFCAGISIDFDFFENNQGSGGLLDILNG